MADSTPPRSAEHSPRPSSSEAARDPGATQGPPPPAGSRLRPGPDSMGRPRTRFAETPSPTPSRDGEQDERMNLAHELLQALLAHDLPTFESLVQDSRVDKNFKYGPPHHSTCLEIACRQPGMGQFVRLLLDYVKPNINRVIPEPIHYAAQKGRSDSLGVLLSDKRTKVYAQNSRGQTALHLACSNFHADRVEDYEQCIRLLVPKMSIADLNKPDCNGFTAFHALVRGHGKRASGKKRPPSSCERGPGDESSEAGEARRAGEAGGEGGAGDREGAARERLATLLLQLAQGALDVDACRAKGRTAREDAEQRFPRLRPLLPARREQQPRADPHVALVTALHEGRIELFRALLEQTDADGNPALDPNHTFGYPLHTTCLELACDHEDRADFVQALLEAGADPNAPNNLNEKYPIHVACEKGHHNELEALLCYSKVIVDVNCEDKFGNTPLHCTVDRISDDKRREFRRRKCLEILLRYPQLDVKRTNKAGYTALLLAVEDGNKYVIKTLLGSKTHFPDVDIKLLRFDGNRIPVRVIIEEQFPQLRALLQRPGAIGTLMLRREERTKELFESLNPVREDEFVKQLNESPLKGENLSKMNDQKFTLLQRAARYGMVKAVEALLDAGVNPNDTFPGNPSPPAVLASFHRHKEVLDLLLAQPKCDVNATDAKGNTALHYAAKAEGNLETVVLLLRNDADITVRNKLGRSPFGKEQVESLLDQCVKTNGKHALAEDYELILDYRLLAPGPHRECDTKKEYTKVNLDDAHGNGPVTLHPASNPPNCGKLMSEMDFLNMMGNDEELSALLDHPVALSFLKLKWDRLKCLSYVNLGVYILFMIFLNVFIVLSTEKISSAPNNTNSIVGQVDKSKNFNDIIPFSVLALFFWMFLACREFSQLALDYRKYVKSFENYLDWAVLISSLSSLILPFTGVNLEVVKTINVITIMLSCIELLLLLGRTSYFAKYIEMLKVVIKNYILPLLSYSVILVAFGLSFHTLYYEQNSPAGKTKNDTDFQTWHMSIVTSMVMMIGELELNSLSNRSPQFIMLFVLFVLLVTVVVLNLLTGLAVSDARKIERAAQQLQLRSRVGVVLRCERILVNMHNAECAAARCLPMPGGVRARLWRALLFPGSALEGREGRVKPNQTGELALGEGAGERRYLDRRTLDRATQIISRRGAAAAPALTLADVDARVKEVLAALRDLEVRCGPVVRPEPRDPLYSQRSVFSEGPEDWEPLTPKADARRVSP